MGVAPPRSPDDVLAALLAYLPPGWAINSAPDGMVANFLRPLAAEQSLFETQAEAQLEEVDPRDANYLLTDYERVLGPDPYGRDVSTDSVALRRQIAFQRWTARGGQSPAYFIGLAASLGVTITITEKRTSACGRSICGDDRTAPTPAQFCWVVGLPETVVQTARCGASNCGAGYLGLITPNPVQAAIEHDAPAHTQPIFSYAG
jgi:uncharacterized protein YmfQ (DUF2313 family)